MEIQHDADFFKKNFTPVSKNDFLNRDEVVERIGIEAIEEFERIYFVCNSRPENNIAFTKG